MSSDLVGKGECNFDQPRFGLWAPESGGSRFTRFDGPLRTSAHGDCPSFGAPQLHEGSTFLERGPEVFLQSVSLAHNSAHKLDIRLAW